MKNLKFFVVMLGLVLLTPAVNSCKNQNHCLEVADIPDIDDPQIDEPEEPEIDETIALPKTVTIKWEGAGTETPIELTYNLTFMKGDEVVTEAKEGETIILSTVVCDNEQYGDVGIKVFVDDEEVDLAHQFVLGAKAPAVEVVPATRLFANIANATVTFIKAEEEVSEAFPGEKVTLDIKPDEGYFILGAVKVNDEEVGLPAEITIGTKPPKIEADIQGEIN